MQLQVFDIHSGDKAQWTGDEQLLTNEVLAAYPFLPKHVPLIGLVRILNAQQYIHTSLSGTQDEMALVDRFLPNEEPEYDYGEDPADPLPFGLKEIWLEE